MAQQPNLFPPNPEDSQPQAAAVPAQPRTPPQNPSHVSRHISWMARAETIVRILVRLYLGVLVMALPWLTFWTQNNLFTYDPLLLTLASSGFVRGVVSGLGLLNIILAVLEARTARELR